MGQRKPRRISSSMRAFVCVCVCVHVSFVSTAGASSSLPHFHFVALKLLPLSGRTGNAIVLPGGIGSEQRYPVLGLLGAAAAGFSAQLCASRGKVGFAALPCALQRFLRSSGCLRRLPLPMRGNAVMCFFRTRAAQACYARKATKREERNEKETNGDQIWEVCQRKREIRGNGK